VTSNQTLAPGGTLSGVNFALTSTVGTLTGTVQDQTTGLALAGVTVTASNGVTTAFATTNSSGAYSISGLTPSNPKYTVTAVMTGWNTQTINNKTINVGPNTQDFTASSSN